MGKFSTELVYNFEAVKDKTVEWKHSAKEIARFMAKRASIEEDYVKSLKSLYNDEHGKEEIGTVATAWQAIKNETQVTQTQHKQFAEALKTQVSEFILEFTQGEKQKRENLIKSGDQLLKQIHTQENAVTKANNKFNTETQKATKAEADFNSAANKSFNQRAKLSTKMDKTKKTAANALSDLQHQQDNLASLKYSTYTESLPSILDELQTIEEGREYTMQQALTTFVQLTKQVNDLANTIANMEAAINQIDSAADMDQFCQMNRVEPDADMPSSLSSSSSAQSRSMSTYGSSSGKETETPSTMASVGASTYSSKIDTMGSSMSESSNDTYRSTGAHQSGLANDGTTRARVMYAFQGESATELSLNVGEIVTVLDKDVSGWWKGVVEDRIGFFPGNYVQEM